jgi:type IV pilus assembly protein PilO
MTISAREKIMLLALLLVAIIAAGYFLVFIPLMEKQDELVMKQVDMQAQADVIKIELAALPGMRENVSGYKNSLADLSSRFYPDIIQEKLILQLDDMVKQSGIIASVYSYTLQQGLTISEIQIGNQNDPVEADSITENSDEASETDTTETTEADLNEQPTESTITDAKLLSANIQFSGTFDQLRKFITLVEDTNRAIRLNNLIYQVEYEDAEDGEQTENTTADTEQTAETEETAETDCCIRSKGNQRQLHH